MRCPFCRELDDRVVDSRMSEDGSAIRRRRECVSCGRRFTTVETVKELRLRVVKKDGTREPFDRTKILNGLVAACYKRPVPGEKLEELTGQVEKQVYQNFDREVDAQLIGELAMEALGEVDNVAYVRFASVYRSFKDAGDFIETARPLLDDEAGGSKQGTKGAGKKADKPATS